MSTTTAVPPEVAEYLAAVRETLRDLPAAERDDLLVEVEASLVEAAEDGGPIAARLGPPEEFAAELRAAAGLHAPEPVPAPALRPRLAEALAAVAASPRVSAAHRLGHELAPIWWLARAYVAVAAFSLWAGWSWAMVQPAIPSFEGSAFSGLGLIAAAAALSVWLGLLARRRRGGLRRLSLAVNAALVLAALPVLSYLADPPQAILYEPAPASTQAGLWYDGEPVENIYPYSRDGRLLLDVLLYDGAGQPISLHPVDDDPLRRVLRTQSGEPVFNAFPLRYFEPGSREVAHPRAGPSVDVPEIATPPLGE